MNKRFLGNIFLLLAMGVGLVTGWANLPFLNQTAEITSDLFLRLLQLISLPIIFLAVTSTITGMKDFQEMKRMGRKVLLYTIGTTLMAATVALILFILINPAARASGIDAPAIEGVKQASYLSFVLNIVPSNVFSAFAEGNVIGIVFIAILFSVAVLLLPSEQKNILHSFFSSLFASMIKLTGFIVTLMPIAIWAFITLLFKDLRQNDLYLNQLLLYLACVIGANLVQGLIILPLLLKFKKISPWKSFKGMSPALAVAFFTKSSNAALPVTIRSAEKNLGVSNRVANFSIPLCSVINMNGCAAFILTTVLFVSSVHGFTFGAVDLIVWIFLATLAAIGNAGVPMGCFFLTSAFLIGMDVPLNMMGLILPFYAIIDMIETALNVWSDACITLTVDKELAAIEVSPAPSQETILTENT